MVVLKMWCLFLLVLLWSNGLATADEESDENRPFTQEIEESVASNETYGYDVHRVLNSKEDSDVQESMHEKTQNLANNTDSNSTFSQSVLTDTPFDIKTSTISWDDNTYVDKNESFITENKLVVRLEGFEKEDGDTTSIFDNTSLPFVSNGSHVVTENKDFQRELFLANKEANFFHGIVNTDDIIKKAHQTFITDADFFEYTTEKLFTATGTTNINDTNKTSTNYDFTTLPSSSLDTFASKSTNHDLSTLSSMKLETASKIYSDNLDSTTVSIVKLNTDREELGYIENVVTHTDNLESLTQSSMEFKTSTDIPIYIYDSINRENSQSITNDLEFTTASDVVPDYLENIKTNVSEVSTDYVEYASASTTEFESVLYTKGDKNSSLVELNADSDETKFNTEVSDFTINIDDLNKTAEDIFNDESYNFPTSRTSSNYRGILETWLHEQKQKLGIVKNESSTDVTVNRDTNFVPVETYNRFNENNSTSSSQELFHSAEKSPYFNGRIIDDTKVPCILLNATYKIYLNGSQIKVPVQYDTFANYKHNYGSIMFNAGDENEKINVSIKFSISCTKRYCSISTITVKLHNASEEANIISEQKDLNLFKTDYGFASENEDRITYMMNNGIVLEINHAKLHVIHYCNISETLGESASLNNYKEIFGGVIAIFILAGLGAYIIIRSHRKQKLVLGS